MKIPDMPELVCLECGATSEDGAGAENASDVEGLDPEVAVYCPECWEREFGDEDE